MTCRPAHNFPSTVAVLLGAILAVQAGLVPIVVETNAPLRVVAANLTGDSQTYQAPAIRIFQGIKPDVVAIQEFRHLQNRPADIRVLVDAAFGTNFHYFREPGYDSGIPNGVISRYPIVTSGTWPSGIENRGFAWARLDIPGTTDLFVVSVHLKASSSDAGTRATQATSLRNLIQTNFPTDAYVVVAGDFNLQTRQETALATLKTFLSDEPIPSDAEFGGNPNTNTPRSRPYDLVLPNATLRSRLAPTLIGPRVFPGGLVFDSRVFTPLSAVAPVQAADSGTAQHMAVVKDFRVPTLTTNWVEVPPPMLVVDEDGVVRWPGVNAVKYRVEVSPDLTSWTAVGDVTPVQGTCTYTNAEPATDSRFLRVVVW